MRSRAIVLRRYLVDHYPECDTQYQRPSAANLSTRTRIDNHQTPHQEDVILNITMQSLPIGGGGIATRLDIEGCAYKHQYGIQQNDVIKQHKITSS